jgi:hypothetical protein
MTMSFLRSAETSSDDPRVGAFERYSTVFNAADVIESVLIGQLATADAAVMAPVATAVEGVGIYSRPFSAEQHTTDNSPATEMLAAVAIASPAPEAVTGGSMEYPATAMQGSAAQAYPVAMQSPMPNELQAVDATTTLRTAEQQARLAVMEAHDERA